MEIETTPSGNAYGQGYRLVYKRDDNSRASLMGQVNTAQKFIRCKLPEVQVNAYLQVGINLDILVAKWPTLVPVWDYTPNNEEDCRRVCAKSDGGILMSSDGMSLLSSGCWGFIYNVDTIGGTTVRRCTYLGGKDAANLDFQTYIM
jgi:hypothetical protein